MSSALRDAWPSFDPGDFRYRVTFLNPVLSADASGTGIAYAPAAQPVTTWAKILDHVRGTDLIKAGQDVSQVYLSMVIRYRPDVVASQRLQGADGTQYVIQAVENLKRLNMYLLLTCLLIGPNQ